MQNILLSTTFWGNFIDLFMSLNAITYNMYNVIYKRFKKMKSACKPRKTEQNLILNFALL